MSRYCLCMNIKYACRKLEIDQCINEWGEYIELGKDCKIFYIFSLKKILICKLMKG